MKLMLLIALLPLVSSGMDRLSALSMIESGDDDRVVGKAGEISRYQVRKSEWYSVTASRNYRDPDVARFVTLKLLERRVTSFASLYNRQPTDFEFYALWNAPSQALTGRISRTVAERSRRFANLCSWNKGTVAGLTRPVLASAQNLF
jgi:hypothetical protein